MYAYVRFAKSVFLESMTIAPYIEIVPVQQLFRRSRIMNTASNTKSRRTVGRANKRSTITIIRWLINLVNLASFF